MMIKATGTIEHGRHLGRTIGIPTINIVPLEAVDDIEKGVYFSKVLFLNGKYEGKTFEGVTNVGCKPTVQDSLAVNFETHIFDFNDDVYGNLVIVELYEFRRPEKKFSSVLELTEAMSADVNAAKEYFKNI